MNIEIDKDKLLISPIAQPLAPEKLEAKMLALTIKAIKKKMVKRGVKEVSKAIRKGTKGLVIFAADISPIDVISHLPVQCERKDIAYGFVRSRLELGQAAQTKRPTSVVLIVEPEGDEKLTKRYEKINSKLRKMNEYF